MGHDDFYQPDNFQEEEYPPSWKPSVGDFLGGIVKRYSRATTEYNGRITEHPIAVIEVEKVSGGELEGYVSPGDEVSFWLMHTVALSKFEKLRPKPGERVGIRKVASPEGKDYHNYVVKVDREVEDEEVPDFAAFKTAASDHGHAPNGAPTHEQKQVQGVEAGGNGPGAPGRGGPPPPDDDLPF